MDKDFDDLGDGHQQIEWHVQWLEEAYRVLRYGGIIRAFCGTRTIHYLLAAMVECGLRFWFRHLALCEWLLEIIGHLKRL